MTNFTTYKFLAGIGAILLFLGFTIPVGFSSLRSFDDSAVYIGSILGITGLILCLIGMKGLDDKIYKKPIQAYSVV